MSEPSQPTAILQYALFEADPSSEPPFSIEVGGTFGIFKIDQCAHIPDGVEKIKEFSTQQGCSFGSNFTLLYPIYMEAMDSEFEGTMHQIAWLVKEAADANHWQFDRIGGLTGKTQFNFLR